MGNGFQRVDTRPKRESSWQKYKPATLAQRYKLRDRCGEVCFLIPGGTPARPDVPAYPICAALDKVAGQCVLSCPGLEAAYKRLRLGLAHYTYGEDVKAGMRRAVGEAIALARKAADRSNPANTCNWALTAAGLRGSAASQLEGGFEPMRMQPGECRQTRRGAVYCYTKAGVRFVRRALWAGASAAGAMAMPFVDGMNFLPGFAARGRGKKMREGECRRTKNGVRFCKRRGVVRFVGG